VLYSLDLLDQLHLQDSECQKYPNGYAQECVPRPWMH